MVRSRNLLKPRRGDANQCQNLVMRSGREPFSGLRIGGLTVVSGPLVVPVANQLESCRWSKKLSNKICHVTEGDKRSAGIIP